MDVTEQLLQRLDELLAEASSARNMGHWDARWEWWTPLASKAMFLIGQLVSEQSTYYRDFVVKHES